MRFALAALALLPASALATITINGPSPTSFWVQFTSNVITWTFTSGDPTPVDILVVNADNTTLNGAFSIARFVDVSIETFTVTNVTLRNGSDYTVEFVNPSNASQVYATSNSFSVMPPGTPPAPSSSVVSSSSASSTGSVSGSAASNAASTGSSSTTTSSGTPAPTSNAAARSLSFGSSNIFPVVVACGAAAFTAMLL